MQLPYEPVSNILCSGESQYCATGWLIKQFWPHANLIGVSGPVYALYKYCGIPLNETRDMDYGFSPIYRKNDAGDYEGAFKMLLPFTEKYKDFFVKKSSQTQYDEVVGKIKAIIEEWEVTTIGELTCAAASR